MRVIELNLVGDFAGVNVEIRFRVIFFIRGREVVVFIRCVFGYWLRVVLRYRRRVGVNFFVFLFRCNGG